MKRSEIESLEELDRRLRQGGGLRGAALQSLDLTGHEDALAGLPLDGTILLGCVLPPRLAARAAEEGALVLPRLPGLPYDPYRGALYSPEELMEGYTAGSGQGYEETLDGRIHGHFLQTGGAGADDIQETLARRLHDHAITDALEEHIEGRRVVAVMGGHALGRDDQVYGRVALLSRRLTEAGVLMASGGGPGAMEATHLGAWFAHQPEARLDQALEMLGGSPGFDPRERWLDSALSVRRRFPRAPAPDGRLPDSLGVPTWLYGHEPPTVFATHIAKYFANSVREDGLLTIARGGVVYAPGSAGTVQEIFQDATQNHYNTAGVVSPMVFFGEDFWTRQRPVYPLLRKLAEGREYWELISITDSVELVVSAIEGFARRCPLPG